MFSRKTKNYYRLKEQHVKNQLRLKKLKGNYIGDSRPSSCYRDNNGRYDPLELVCGVHNVKFIKFECKVSSNPGKSHGCPVCVKIIRDKVQLEMHRRNESTKIRDGRIIYGPKRGRPKIQTPAAATREGITV